MAPANRVRYTTPTKAHEPLRLPVSPLSDEEGIPTEDVSSSVSPLSDEQAIPVDYFAIPVRRKPSNRLRSQEAAAVVPEAARPICGAGDMVPGQAPRPNDIAAAYTQEQRRISELESQIKYLKHIGANRASLDGELDEATRMNMDYQRQIACLMGLMTREEKIPSRPSKLPAGNKDARELREPVSRNLHEIKSDGSKALEDFIAQIKLVEEENVILREELSKRMQLEENVNRYCKRHEREIRKHLDKQASLEQDLEEKNTKILGLEARLERQERELRELRRGREMRRTGLAALSILTERVVKR